MQSEQDFLNSYNLADYPPVGVTVDFALFTIVNGKLCVLMVERGQHPYKGVYALPGGFVSQDETLEQSVVRELQEETSISARPSWLEQLGTYGSPDRDPRGYIVSTAYVAFEPNLPEPQGGDDAKKAVFLPVSEVVSNYSVVAFDHKEIIKDALRRVQAKLNYSTIALSFIDGDVFTMSELRDVYETVWMKELTPSVFRRHIESAKGVLEPVGVNSEGVMLYRRGSSQEIYPPFIDDMFTE